MLYFRLTHLLKTKKRDVFLEALYTNNEILFSPTCFPLY
jgi:hypothetical protein